MNLSAARRRRIVDRQPLAQLPDQVGGEPLPGYPPVRAYFDIEQDCGPNGTPADLLDDIALSVTPPRLATPPRAEHWNLAVLVHRVNIFCRSSFKPTPRGHFRRSRLPTSADSNSCSSHAACLANTPPRGPPRGK
jgi:hypothetical protein